MTISSKVKVTETNTVNTKDRAMGIDFWVGGNQPI
jgi:hypothetical protein